MPTPACPWSVWTSAINSGTMLRGTARIGLLSLGVYHTRFFSSIKYRSCSGHVFFCTPLIMICFRRGSLLCCAASRYVSVSAFRARMADAVSAGASAAVEELVTSPPTKRTSSISAVAAGGAVRSVSFLLGSTVIGVEATWFEWGFFGGMSIGISSCRLGLVSASPCSGLLLCV